MLRTSMGAIVRTVGTSDGEALQKEAFISSGTAAYEPGTYPVTPICTRSPRRFEAGG